MKIGRTERFKKAFKQLDEKERKSARKAIENLAENMKYPSLRVKKIKGTEHIWEAWASQSLRMTFEITADTIILRNIGHHDEALKQP